VIVSPPGGTLTPLESERDVFVLMLATSNAGVLAPVRDCATATDRSGDGTAVRSMEATTSTTGMRTNALMTAPPDAL
ncbi:MAG TPA: hypothetical protein VFT26_07440, partial [Pyrinomonadaceae bacterium]|nr:hypothetical protein [Pyrinomonadaceae bacterium]